LRETVAAGGISKRLDRLPRSGLTRAIQANLPSGRLMEIVREADCPDAVAVQDDPDQSRTNISINSIVGGAVAETLLNYGQKLMAPFG
jgi:hypothetical protein